MFITSEEAAADEKVGEHISQLHSAPDRSRAVQVPSPMRIKLVLQGHIVVGRLPYAKGLRGV
jgi:hypothetical protein